MMFFIIVCSFSEVFLYAFSKNANYMLLVLPYFAVHSLYLCYELKYKVIFAVISVVCLGVGFYGVLTDYIAYGAYIDDYAFMLIRLIILTLIVVTAFLPEKNQKGDMVID